MAITRARVFSLYRTVETRPLKMADTNWFETPAFSATSLMVTGWVRMMGYRIQP